MLRAVAAHLQPQPAAASESEGLEEPKPDQNTPPLLSAAHRADITARGSAAVEELIVASMATAQIPAVSVSIVKRGEVAWAQAFGLANVERQIPATTDTIFGLASVTKTVTAVAVMQLYEAGLVELDVDVSLYLPFPVIHPGHPNTPVTLRALMTHTAAISDAQVWMGNGKMGQGLGYAGGDMSVNLTHALREYLVQGGAYCSAAHNWHPWAPSDTKAGTYIYSNVGIALVGLIVQCVSGEDYHEYCTAHILRPLGLRESYWLWADMLQGGLPLERLAMPYGHAEIDGFQRLMPFGVYGYPDTPSGNLRCSAAGVGVFLAMFAGGGCGANGVRLLKRETVEMMMRPQAVVTSEASSREAGRDEQTLTPVENSTQGLVWAYSPRTAGSGEVGTGVEGMLLGHSGGDPGVATWIGFAPDGQLGDDGEGPTGVVCLTNCSPVKGTPVAAAVTWGGQSLVEQALFAFAESL